MPEDIGLVYAAYYTHGAATRPGEVFSRYFSGRLAALRNALIKHIESARSIVVGRELEYGDVQASRPSTLAGALARVPSLIDGAVLAFAGLHARARGKLLDVGCGNGEFLLRMRDAGWHVTGIEPDSAAADYAVKQHGLDVRVGQLEDARFPDGRFEAIVLSHVVEHVYDPVALLRECGRVLTNGGTIVVLTPNAKGLGHRLLGRNWRGLEPPRHLQIFDPSTLVACARQAGLRVTNLRTSTRLMRGIWYVSRSMQRGDRTGVPYNTRLDYIASYFMAAVEDVLRLVAPGMGEELVLTATVAVGMEER